MCAIWGKGGRGRALTWARTRFSRQAPGETWEGALDPCASERRKAEPTAVEKARAAPAKVPRNIYGPLGPADPATNPWKIFGDTLFGSGTEN